MKNKVTQSEFRHQAAMGISVSAALLCIIPLLLVSLVYGGLFAPVLIILSCVVVRVAEMCLRHLLTHLLALFSENRLLKRRRSVIKIENVNINTLVAKH